MTQRASVERKTSASDGGGGYTDTWSALVENLPCRVYALKTRIGGITGAIGGEQVVSAGAGTRTRELLAALVPKGTDVTEGDRLTSITDRQGNVAFRGPVLVDSVGEYPDHIRLTVRRMD
jgi:hypothetical protein